MVVGRLVKNSPQFYADAIILYCVRVRIASVVRVPAYRSKGPGSIPGVTRLSEK
jgi:hypothetical protein